MALLMRALERFAEPVDRVAGGGAMRIVSSSSCQLIQAAMPKQTSDLERFEQGLAEQALHALADRVEVGGAAVHEVAAAGLGEVGHVEAQHLGDRTRIRRS